MMGETTLISWCDSTCNAEMGCDGCELWNALRHSCYAGLDTEKRAGNKGWPKSFGEPALFTHRIDEAIRWTDLTGIRRPDKPWLDHLPRVIFLDDEGDTFTESLDLFWLRPFLERMERSPHQWLVLTKRPRRAADFFRECGCPGNVWVGTSVTDQATAEARIPALDYVPARIRFVSCEPMLGPVDFSCGASDPPDSLRPFVVGRLLGRIDWVIAGGESGKEFRPMDPAWALAVKDACVSAGVPFFFKQSSGPRTELDPVLDGTEWRQMPEVL